MNEITIFIHIITLILSFGTISFIYKGFIFRKIALEESNLLAIQNNSTSAQSLQVYKLLKNTEDLLTRKLNPDNELTHSAAEIGIGNIQFLLSSIIDLENEKPYLFGINKGGAFIANYLAHRMDLHQKYLVKCDYNNSLDKIYCENREISGPIVIIDDVIRTGATFRKVKDYLNLLYKDSHIKIYSIVLVVCSPSDNMDNLKLVDYSPWVTSDKNIILPWSKALKGLNDSNNLNKKYLNNKKDQIINSIDFFNDKEVDQIIGRIQYLKDIENDKK